MKYEIDFYVKYYVNKIVTTIRFFILGLRYPTKINKGDKIVCHGIGYPHLKGQEFECTLDFKDGTIGIKGCVRVSEKDFRKI